MTEEEYLLLFKNINQEEKPKKEELFLIKETPDYSKYQSENLNETPDVSKYKLTENLNDGWNFNFEFETRVNGEVQKHQSPVTPYVHQTRRNRNQQSGINNLSLYNDYDNVDEVYRMKEMRVAQQEQIVEHQYNNSNSMNLNEVWDFSRLDIVTYEIFERINCAELKKIHQNIR